MDRFQTTLLREKFVIQTPKPGMPDISVKGDALHSIIALSNRVEIVFETQSGHVETYIVRAQNMHVCARFAAQIVRLGNVTRTQVSGIDDKSIKKSWLAVINNYEKQYNSHLWASVYYKGKPLFEYGSGRHVFLDMVEKCYYGSDEEYDKAVSIAEEMLKSARGKNIKVLYDANTALVVDYKQFEGRNGIIFRSPDNPATFSFFIHSREEKEGRKPLNYARSLQVAAGYLEGIQLSFFIGDVERRKMKEEIDAKHPDYRQSVAARERLKYINVEIINLEAAYHVIYRAERPSFDEIIETVVYKK